MGSTVCVLTAEVGGAEAPMPTPIPTPEKISLKVEGDHNSPLHFLALPITKFSKLKTAYCQKHGINPDEIVFLYTAASSASGTPLSVWTPRVTASSRRVSSLSRKKSRASSAA